MTTPSQDPPANTKPNPFSGLTVGRVVHFVMYEGPGRGQHRAAIVTAVLDQKGTVNLNVMRDAVDGAITMTAATFILPKVAYSEDTSKESTWHWPERVE